MNDYAEALYMLGSMTGQSDSRLLSDSVISRLATQVLGTTAYPVLIAFARAVEQAVLANSVVKESITTDKEQIL